MKHWIKYLFIGIMILVVLCNDKEIEAPALMSEKTNIVSADEVFTVDIVYDSTVDEAVIGRVKAAVQARPAETIKTFVEKGWKIVISSEGYNVVDYETKTLRLHANRNIETVVANAFELFMKGQSDET